MDVRKIAGLHPVVLWFSKTAAFRWLGLLWPIRSRSQLSADESPPSFCNLLPFDSSPVIRPRRVPSGIHVCVCLLGNENCS
jgi:hypothetical protein